MTGALAAAIVADPEDAAAYLVYADALQAAGDPRGELIVVQAARAADPASEALAAAETALFEAHRAAWFGPEDAIEHGRFDWFHGFWRGLTVGTFGWRAQQTSDAHVAQLIASPSARFVRDLSCMGAITPRVLELAAPLAATLRVLHVSLYPHNTFADEDLLALEPFTQLRALHLFSCEPLTHEGLAVLAGLGELRNLDLRNCPLTDAIAGALVGLPLVDVMFNAIAPTFSAAGMRALAAMPVRRLHLGTERVDDALVMPLAAHPTLRNLELHGATLGAAGVGALASTSLRRLRLSSSAIADRDLAQLAGLAPHLASLSLGHSQASDAACEAIGQCARLQFLDLGATEVTGAGLRALARLSALEQLDLAFLSCDDNDVAVLASLPKLRNLNLAHNRVTDRAIDTLMQLPNLASLDLASTDITPAAIDRLMTLPHLTELGLEDCDGATIARAQQHPGWHVNTRDLVELYDELEAET